MARSQLPDDGFDYYVSLGANRSYQAVASRFAISKRSVTRRAMREDWQGQLDRLAQGIKVKTSGEPDVAQVERLAALHDAVRDVITPERMKALVATLFKAAVRKDDVRAARLLMERLLGRPRNEIAPGIAMDLPDGLETASDVRKAANALLRAVVEGRLAPEDAQRAASVIEAARKSVETEELERRISEIEEQVKKERGR